MTQVLFDLPGPKARARHNALTIAAVIALSALLAWVLWVLWREEQITPDKWESFTVPRILLALAEGLVQTLVAAAVAIVLALAFGAVFASGRLSDHAIVRWPCTAVIEFFRAVPLLLLILVIFFSQGNALGPFWSLVLGLMLYNGAVLAEIFRAGIMAVPRGQSEAAYAVGMRKSQVMRLVLAPQAVRSMLPAIVSQAVVALKDTALGYVITAGGIVDVGERIYIFPEYDNALAVGIVLAAVFIVINYSLSRLAIYLESRMRGQGKRVIAPPTVEQLGGGGPYA
jgi:glutamate transport system permease protein